MRAWKRKYAGIHITRGVSPPVYTPLSHGAQHVRLCYLSATATCTPLRHRNTDREQMVVMMAKAPLAHPIVGPLVVLLHVTYVANRKVYYVLSETCYIYISLHQYQIIRALSSSVSSLGVNHQLKIQGRKNFGPMTPVGLRKLSLRGRFGCLEGR